MGDLGRLPRTALGLIVVLVTWLAFGLLCVAFCVVAVLVLPICIASPLILIVAMVTTAAFDS